MKTKRDYSGVDWRYLRGCSNAILAWSVAEGLLNNDDEADAARRLLAARVAREETK